MPEWKIKTRVRKCLKRWRVYFCYFLSFPISVGQISFAMCVFSIVKFIILLKCLHFAGFELTEREPKNEICIRSKDTRGAERLRCEDDGIKTFDTFFIRYLYIHLTNSSGAISSSISSENMRETSFRWLVCFFGGRRCRVQLHKIWTHVNIINAKAFGCNCSEF